MTCPSDIKRHVAEALGNDPQRAIVAVRRLVADDLPWLEARAVRLGRSEGYSWAVLGRMLGKSRQAIRQRFVSIDGTPQPLPRPPMSDDDRIMTAWNRARSDVRRRREFADLGPNDVVPW